MSYKITTDQIFAKTNGGLDIIREYLPEAVEGKHFKIRKEGTESANMKKNEGVYFVKDWGDAGGFYGESKNAIHIYAKEHNISFGEAIYELGESLGLVEKTPSGAKNISKMKFHQFEGTLNADGFCYETKDFTDEELEIFGPLVTAELCHKHKLYSLKTYSWVKSADLQQKELCDVITVESSASYPIFGFIHTKKVGEIEKTWVKIYQPKSKDKKYRFFYLGKKPKEHIFGLDILKASKQIDIRKEKDPDTGEIVEIEKEKKIDRVIICSGDRDAINMASFGEVVVWFNSETANINESIVKMFYKYADNIVNVPDLDPTGFDAGKNLALEHLEIKTAWLPLELLQTKDWRGNPMKDFTDFVKTNKSWDDKDQKVLRERIKRFVELARPGQFWVKHLQKGGKITYSVNYKNAFNFLKLNGFYRIKDEARKDGFYYVKQDKHVIREVYAQEIKDFFNRFLDEKQKDKGMRHFPDELLNMIIGSDAVSATKLINLETKEFDFTAFEADAQYFFFDKFIWRVSKNGIEEINKDYPRYVMENDVLNNIIKKIYRVNLDTSKMAIEAPFFEITKDSNKNFELKILRNDCEFMNYFINSSRVHWQDELAGLKTPEEMIKYMDENKYIIDKSCLTDDQIYEQELHFINKCFAFGYLLHSFKVSSKAWLVYAMDNKIVEDGKSYGRTGKSLFLNLAIRIFKKAKYIGSRDPKVTENEFKYHGVTDQTKYILYDDADKRFAFKNLFTDVTGDMHVNPKNGEPYQISFNDSGKLALSTNFAPFDLGPSDLDRILFIAFSDWYHGESDDMKFGRKPIDDFGHEFFKDWSQKQWFLFINFAMQCLQFYLSTNEKIAAPSENIRKRNILQEIGTLKEWADDYFVDANLDELISKKDALEAFRSSNKNVAGTSAQIFISRLKQYCELMGYELNPSEFISTKDNRIIKKIQGVTTEMIFIRTTNTNQVEDYL